MPVTGSKAINPYPIKPVTKQTSDKPIVIVAVACFLGFAVLMGAIIAVGTLAVPEVVENTQTEVEAEPPPPKPERDIDALRAAHDAIFDPNPHIGRPLPTEGEDAPASNSEDADSKAADSPKSESSDEKRIFTHIGYSFIPPSDLSFVSVGTSEDDRVTSVSYGQRATETSCNITTFREPTSQRQSELPISTSAPPRDGSPIELIGGKFNLGGAKMEPIMLADMNAAIGRVKIPGGYYTDGWLLIAMDKEVILTVFMAKKRGEPPDSFRESLLTFLPAVEEERMSSNPDI